MKEKQRCIKMDEITKNMIIHSLRDIFREERDSALPTDETRDLVLKLAAHEEVKLFLTDAEYRKVIQALNHLRDDFISAGRYTDGIDTVMSKIMRSKYKRCASR